MSLKKYKNESDADFLKRRAEARSVGNMRKQSALCSNAEEIVIVGPHGVAHIALPKLRVVRTYPDTTGSDGKWGGTFKIEVEFV